MAGTHKPFSLRQVNLIRAEVIRHNGYSDGVKANETILRLIATVDRWKELYLKETVG